MYSATSTGGGGYELKFPKSALRKLCKETVLGMTIFCGIELFFGSPHKISFGKNLQNMHPPPHKEKNLFTSSMLLIFQCVDRELKLAENLRYTDDELLHVAIIATNVNR